MNIKNKDIGKSSYNKSNDNLLNSDDNNEIIASKKKQDIILGLDISTACIGCCLILNDGSDYGKIIELTHIVPKVSKKIKTIESLFLKNKFFTEDFLMKWQNKGITRVVIESPLLNSNNTNTVATLLQFNGMVSESVYNVLGIVPEYISSYDARKYSFPFLMSIRKFDKKGQEYPKTKIINNIKKNNFVLFGSFPWDVDKKSVLQSYVSSFFPDIEWVYGKNGELRKENFDASDAYIACLGFLNKERYGELNINVENIVEKETNIQYTVKYWDKTETRNIILH